MSGTERHFELRSARASDQLTIWRLVLGAGLNPLHLHWQNFILAVSSRGELLGCGQIKPHKDGSRELASIYVVPEQRGNGLAQAIIERLLSDHPAPIWLTCRRELTGFYDRFGFDEIQAVDEMPVYFRRVRKLVDFFTRTSDGSPLAVMCWRGE